MALITISYRRADSGADAGRICERLRKTYGKKSVVMDIDNIPYGVNFLNRMNEILNKTDILVAVVGRDWLGHEPDGTRQIDKETDFVRIEVETALKRGIPIIPVLVSRAEIPKPDDLPVPIREFTYYNGAVVDYGRDFDVHMDRLIAAMNEILRTNQVKNLTEQIEKLRRSADAFVGQERRAELRGYINGLVKSADELLSKERKIELNFSLKPKSMSKGMKYALIGGGIFILLVLIGLFGGG